MPGSLTQFYRRRGPRPPSTADMLQQEIGKETPEAANDYLGRTIQSLTTSGIPGFQNQLQDIRENAIRRGVSGGDLGTSYEGDLASAFQRNIANEAGSRAYDAYQTSRNRRLDLLTGQRDYETAQANAKRARGGFFGKLLGGVAGSFLGPLGAAAGENLGGKLFKF